jgi:hypothetical protein
VAAGEVTDREKPALAEQAYKLELAANQVQSPAMRQPACSMALRRSCNSSSHREEDCGCRKGRSKTGRSWNCG